MAYIVMAYKVMAYIVMACIVMSCVVMAYKVMAYKVMAYIVMATRFSARYVVRNVSVVGTYSHAAAGGDTMVPMTSWPCNFHGTQVSSPRVGP